MKRRHWVKMEKWGLMSRLSVLPILTLLLSCNPEPEIKLLVRGDDMGGSHDANMGIIKAHQEGIVTSASILPGSSHFEEAVELCKANPGLSAGIHLTLTNTASRPILPVEEVPSLVNAEGFLFETRAEFEANNPRPEEIEKEFRAQIAKVRATGLRICYLDIHRDFPPVAKEIIRKLCKEEKLIYGDDPIEYGYIRKTMLNEKWPFITNPDGSITYIDAPPLSEEDKESFYSDMENLTPGGWALYSHPYLEEAQGASTTALLCSDRIKQIIKDKKIELVGYCDIWEEVYGKESDPVSTEDEDSKDELRINTGFINTPYPRIAMLWRAVRGEQGIESIARHDLIMLGHWSLGLKPDREPVGLATGFTPASMDSARQMIRKIRELNPDAVILADLLFYEYMDEWLPDDHPWWLRKDGERQQFWPGTHRMDWYNAEYRAKVIKQTEALKAVGVDGVFYDNLRNETEPWVAFLTDLRKAVGDDFLIFINAGYDVGTYNFAYPFINGVMYESGWSHDKTEWEETIEKMQYSQSLLREPKISLIERFEETRSRAGWPGDPKRGQKPPDDPAARRWSLCYALTIGDFYYLFADNTSHRHDWYPEYDIKIGLPLEDGKKINSHVWTRRYEKALVVVNLPGATSNYMAEFQDPRRDSLTGEKGTSFVIPPGEGRIILNAGL